jgi:hypothetical protein
MIAAHTIVNIGRTSCQLSSPARRDRRVLPPALGEGRHRGIALLILRRAGRQKDAADDDAVPPPRRVFEAAAAR